LATRGKDRGSLKKGTIYSFSTLFSKEIVEVPRVRLKCQIIDPFDSTTDTDDHLDVKKAYMYLQDVDDAACYKCFPVTLKRVTRKPFSGLPNGSITFVSSTY